MVFHFLQDLFFPTTCVVCNREGKMLCDVCRYTMMRAPLSCPYCEAMSPSGTLCVSCINKGHALSGAISLFDYEDPKTQQLISAIKYRGLHGTISNLLPDFEEALSKLTNMDMVLPVPQTRRSLIARGFNQSALLAKALSRSGNISYMQPLRAHNKKNQQHQKKQSARWKLVGRQIYSKRLAKRATHAIVVDDVLTTGATLEACARALKSQGVKEIWGLTIARQRKKY